MSSCCPSYFACCFFSSRRRHTRYWRDWSSDVCSSDLGQEPLGLQVCQLGPDRGAARVNGLGEGVAAHGSAGRDVELQRLEQYLPLPVGDLRSEERRVGKECRSRWSPYH